jgi:hypothetical protein
VVKEELMMAFLKGKRFVGAEEKPEYMMAVSKQTVLGTSDLPLC